MASSRFVVQGAGASDVIPRSCGSLKPPQFFQLLMFFCCPWFLGCSLLIRVPGITATNTMGFLAEATMLQSEAVQFKELNLVEKAELEQLKAWIFQRQCTALKVKLRLQRG